jgi:hypothetical protein
MIRLLLLLIVFPFLLCSCRSTRVVNTWKAQNIIAQNYNEILVVGIVKENSAILKKQAESYFVKELEKLGYKAISSFATYGESGLAGTSQEDTYIKLRNTGVGAVLTIALIDKDKEKEEGMDKVEEYNTPYYYKRIWHYRNMRADISDSLTAAKNFDKYYWETILFELNALETHYVVQTSPLKNSAAQASFNNYAKVIFKSMRKKGVFKVQKKQPQKEPENPEKAF